MKNKMMMFSIISILAGILLLVLKGSYITNAVFFLIGGYLIFIGGYNVYLSIKQKYYYSLAEAFIYIIIGIILMFYHGTILMIIFGLLLLVFPIIRIIKAINKTEEFLIELPKLVLGIVFLILSPEAILTAMYKVTGVIFLILGIYTLVKSYKIQDYDD